eukprot:1015030-Rhodomonas_salina.1
MRWRRCEKRARVQSRCWIFLHVPAQIRGGKVRAPTILVSNSSHRHNFPAETEKERDPWQAPQRG